MGKDFITDRRADAGPEEARRFLRSPWPQGTS
jgi:hypothetical protein